MSSSDTLKLVLKPRSMRKKYDVKETGCSTILFQQIYLNFLKYDLLSYKLLFSQEKIYKLLNLSIFPISQIGLFF